MTATARDDGMEIAVADTGAGIPSEQLERIFEASSQAPTSNPEGTGLGLNIAKELVRLMGGTIEVSSDPGQGATFTVRLQRGPGRLAILSA